MPPSKKYPRRKKMVKRRRTRVPRRVPSSSSDMACHTEQHEFSLLDMNEAYLDYQVSLARFTRATQIAKSFREYRITKVEYDFIPQNDTFAPGSTLAVPWLYVGRDPTGSLKNVNDEAQFSELGFKPIRFDDKTIRKTFKPAVLDYVYDQNNGTNTWARPIYSPWLATNKINDNPAIPGFTPSSIDHLGIVWAVYTTPKTVGVAQYIVRMRAHFEFRKPQNVLFLSTENVTKQAPSANPETA